MYVITGGRQSGKTEAMYRWLTDDLEHRIIVVSDQRRVAEHVRELHRRFPNIVDWPWQKNFMTWAVALGRHASAGHRQGAQFAFDDVDELLRSLVHGADVTVVTMTATSIPIENVNQVAYALERMRLDGDTRT